jgi:thioredoxin-dependent peroxiredoxin
MEGKKLPAVTFLDHDGNKVKSSELKTPFVLYAYPKDDTPGCTKEACGIRDEYGAFQKVGLHVYGISADDAKSHQKFIAKYELPFTLLTADEAGLDKLGFWKEKNMYGRKYWGVERSTFLIDEEGKVEKVWARVRPKGHAAVVAEELG